jgi:cyclopropane fatty-acyl-phospholipid synthase-like methyltransferase
MVAAGYDRVADAYERLEEEGAEWPRLRRVRELLALVPAGGTVLDLGCGNGVPVLREIAAHHVAVGVDVSREQVRRARRNVPEATVIHADMSELEFDEQAFDAIVSCYSIEHVPRERHARLFERIHVWLKPGGRLLFAVEARDAFEAVGTWLETPMFFSLLDEDEMLRLLERVGLRVERREPETQVEGGRPIEYLWVLAQRGE